jgi:glycosyltransferase involved in cell wall biosynthesis
VTIDVSIVIPTHGRLEFLRSALCSAMRQHSVSYEIVVVDDASSDGTREWLDSRRGEGLRVVRHAAQRGVSAARNSGLEVAQGRWIAFLDDDDVWAPDKLKSQLGEALRLGRGWVYAGDVHVDEHLRTLGGGPPLPPHEVMKQLSAYNTLPSGASNVMIRAGVLSDIGTFDTSLTRTEDWDMWLRLAATGPPACVPRPLVAYRHHRGNASSDPAPMVTEPRVLSRRYDMCVDQRAMLRRAGWSCMLDGRRLRAAGYYVRAAFHGDAASLARALVAMAHPAVGSTDVYRLIGWSAEARRWAADAEVWLAALRASESVAVDSPGCHPPERGR